MKKKKVLFYSIGLLLVTALFFWEIAQPSKSDYNALWSNIKSQLKRDNPNWTPTVGDRGSGVQPSKKGLVIFLCGPDLKNLSSLDQYNFYVVSLMNVEIKNLNFLKNSDKLEKLFIASASGVKDISILHNKKLNHLSLSRTGVEDISILKKLPLEKLSLSFSEVADISPLSKIKTLTLVGFSGCKKLKDISSLANSPALKYVMLSNSGVEDLTPLKGIELDYLDITNTPAAKKPLPKDLKVKKIYK